MMAIYEETTSCIETDAPSSKRTRRPIFDERIGRQVKQFGQRLTEVIGKEPVRAFARRATISEGAIRQYMDGKRYPDLDFLAAIVIAGEVNFLWMATGEGPKHPQTRGSPDSVQEKSADYVCDAQKGWIRKAVEAVERMRPDAPPDRKAVAVEQVYDRLVQTDGAADMIELMRFIQAALDG